MLIKCFIYFFFIVGYLKRKLNLVELSNINKTKTPALCFASSTRTLDTSGEPQIATIGKFCSIISLKCTIQIKKYLNLQCLSVLPNLCTQDV